MFLEIRLSGRPFVAGCLEALQQSPVGLARHRGRLGWAVLGFLYWINARAYRRQEETERQPYAPPSPKQGGVLERLPRDLGDRGGRPRDSFSGRGLCRATAAASASPSNLQRIDPGVSAGTLGGADLRRRNLHHAAFCATKVTNLKSPLLEQGLDKRDLLHYLSIDTG